MMLALSAIQQAENEIPKAAPTASAFQALENIRRELKEGRLKPIRARHEEKIMFLNHKEAIRYLFHKKIEKLF